MPQENTETLNMAEPHQFIRVMENVADKLANFRPAELKVLDDRIKALEGQIARASLSPSQEEHEYRALLLNYFQARSHHDQARSKLESASSPATDDNPFERAELKGQLNQAETAIQALTADPRLNFNSHEDLLRSARQSLDPPLNPAASEQQIVAELENWERRFRESRAGLQLEKEKLGRKRAHKESSYQQQLQRLATYRQEINAALDLRLPHVPIKELNEEKQSKLVDALGPLSETIPDPYYADTLKKLKTNVEAALFDREVQTLQKQLQDQLSHPLDRPGNKGEFKVSLKLGGAVGKLFKLGVEPKFELTYAVEVGDNQEVAVKQVKDLKIVGEIGSDDTVSKVASLKGMLEGGLKFEQSRTFNSKEDFIKANANTFVVALQDYRGVSTRSPSSIKTYHKTQKANRLREKAQDEQRTLEQQAIQSGFIGADQQLSVPQKNEVDYIKTATTTNFGSSGLGAKVKVGVFETSLESKVTGEKLREVKIRTVPYLDEVSKHHGLLEMQAIAHSKNLGFQLSDRDRPYRGDEALRKLREMGREIENLGDADTVERDYQREQLKTAIEQLQLEYQVFAYQEQHAAGASSLPAEATRVRDRLLEGRQVENAAEYVRAVSLQYAYLRGLYQSTFRPEESPDQNDGEFDQFNQEFEKTLKQPEFRVDDKLMDQTFNLEQIQEAQKTKLKVSGQFQPAVTGSRGSIKGLVSVEYTRTTTTGQPQPEQEIAIKGEGSLEAAIPFINTAVESGGLSPYVDKDEIGAVRQEIEQLGKEDAGSVVSGKVTGKLPLAAKAVVEIKLVKKHDRWNLSYVRLSDERSIGGEVEATVVTPAGVSVKGGMGLANTAKHIRFEYLGRNSLGYLVNLHEGKALREGVNAWKYFREQNPHFFKALNQNLRDPTSSASKDLDEWLKTSKAGTAQEREAAEGLGKVLREYRRNPNLAPSEKALNIKFDQLLDRRLQSRQEKKYDDFRTRIKTRDLKGYAIYQIEAELQRLAQRLAQRHRRSTPDAKTPEDLLTWAKALEPDKYRQETIEEAEALDYADRYLKDVLQTGDNSERYALMKDITDIQQLYRRPRIYLGKETYAELERTGDRLKIKPSAAIVVPPIAAVRTTPKKLEEYKARIREKTKISDIRINQTARTSDINLALLERASITSPLRPWMQTQPFYQQDFISTEMGRDDREGRAERFQRQRRQRIRADERERRKRSASSR